MEVASQKWFQNNKRLHTWMDPNRDNHMSPYFCLFPTPQHNLWNPVGLCVRKNSISFKCWLWRVKMEQRANVANSLSSFYISCSEWILFICCDWPCVNLTWKKTVVLLWNKVKIPRAILKHSKLLKTIWGEQSFQRRFSEEFGSYLFIIRISASQHL